MNLREKENLVRGNWHVTESQSKLIKKLSKKYRISESQVIRGLIDNYLEATKL